MTVLVDSSVWVAHFRKNSEALGELLVADSVLVHPLIIGELACGSPPNRAHTLRDLGRLQQVQQPVLQHVLDFIEKHQLYGLGCGLIDLTLLASTLITPGAVLWTIDKRLAELADKFNVGFRFNL